MRVDGAWPYSTGQGITVGLTDTGVDLSYGVSAEWSTSQFAQGLSSGRPPFQQYLVDQGPSNITCAHGSRSAGLIGAPRNGRSMVGVAYKSGLLSAYIDSDVLPAQFAARNGIRQVAQMGAKVISMPWGILNDAQIPVWSDIIADEIRYWDAPGRDVLFVAAAGTSPWAGLNQNYVVFPAEMAEVLALSAVELADPMIRPTDAHYGLPLDVVAYTNNLTTGMGVYSGSQQFTSLGGSSGATAVATGIAALVRSRYPSADNQWVRNRLVSTGGMSCGNLRGWHIVLNAEAAVGGVCVPNGSPAGTTQITFDRAAYGDIRTSTIEEFCLNFTGGTGPFSITWPNALPGSAGSGPYCRRYTFNRGTYTATLRANLRDQGTTGALERSYSKTVNVVDLENNPGCTTCVRISSLKGLEITKPGKRRSPIR
jgi:subtilisin family serine protease